MNGKEHVIFWNRCAFIRGKKMIPILIGTAVPGHVDI